MDYQIDNIYQMFATLGFFVFAGFSTWVFWGAPPIIIWKERKKD